tara:strand:+ start:715 stop:1548 length:834 start_codon:yes stop_codon:yes gene_type:complete
MKNILILGSSGQIGLELTKFLKSKNYNVFEFDIVEDELEDLRIHNNEILEKYIRDSDFVFFLAFDVGGSRYLQKYQKTFEFLHNNVRIMSNTFYLLMKYSKPFIFSSSQMSNMSYSPYGVSKAVGENYTSCLGGLTVKFWNVYGEERDLEKSHVITDFINKAKHTGVINMLSDGTESRQFLHAQDCCECLLKLSLIYDNLDKSKEYHITSFSWNTINEIAEQISKNFENCKIERAESKDDVQKDKKNEPDPYILNFWKPKITIEEGIRDIIKKMEQK